MSKIDEAIEPASTQSTAYLESSPFRYIVVMILDQPFPPKKTQVKIFHYCVQQIRHLFVKNRE